ncbi:MAG: ATP-binding protein [Psychrosphaera sp.]|nr:ATP-binding protein [Psychrosphaera sp.]
MKRLFFSLYFVVVLALVIIGWSSDKVWQLIQSSSDVDAVRIVGLSKAIRLIEHLDNPTQRQLLSDTIDAPVHLIGVTDIAWLDEQLVQLAAGESIMTYDEQDRLLIYMMMIASDKQLIQIGPIALGQHDGDKQRLLIFLSYLLLAVVIGLWSRPLWRDLRVLQQATEKFGQGQWHQVPKVSKNSVIAPVVETFNTMSGRISRLVEEQKELTNPESHELRTPLSRLKFSLALSPPDDTDNAAGMRDDINELEALVDEMLSYSRLESGARSLVLAQVNVNELLDNLLEKLGHNAGKNLELAITPNVVWSCDGHFIERALQNLITNAIRYANQTVLVTVKTNNHSILLTIEDDGSGIDEKDRSQVFKPFVRLDKSRARENGGFGLGLAIVKRIVDWHKGEVSVSGSSLGGAKFMIELPLL